MAPGEPAPTPILHNAVLFGRVLREAGVAVDPAAVLTFVRALEHVDIGRRRDFHAAARCTLVRRREDLATFDEVFRVFWRQPKDPRATMDLRSLGEQRRYRTPQVAPPRDGDGDGEEGGTEGSQVALPRSYSAREVLRAKDFADCTPEEAAQVRRLLEELAWDVGRRRTRRWVPGRGPALDLRRALRAARRLGGELAVLPRRRRRERPRPLVLLCDISGSMEQYTRMLLHFMHAIGRRERVEAFVFATRLTRITRRLAHRGVDRAVREVAQAVPDWAGGTRIGEALRTFNHRWSRRVLRSGSVVLLISDGWDRGDPETLARETARLQRSCHRLVWLNPLAGSPGYEPLTQGMRAAVPYVDDLLPAHNLASLEDLAGYLNALPRRRGERAQRGRPGASTSAGLTEETPPTASPPRGHLGARPTFRHPLWGRG